MSIKPYLHVIILVSIYVGDFELFKCMLKSVIIISTFLSKSIINYLSIIYFDFL
jgi:hypothetical protein